MLTFISDANKIGSGRSENHVPAGVSLREREYAVGISRIVADDLAVHFPHLKLGAFQAGTGIGVLLDDGQPAGGRVAECKGLGVILVDTDRLGIAIENVAFRCRHFRDNIRVRLKVRDTDLTIGIGSIKAVGRHRAALVRDIFAAGRGDLEHGACKGLFRNTVDFLDDKSAMSTIRVPSGTSSGDVKLTLIS